MEWSTRSNIDNMRCSFMPQPWLEANSFNSLHSFNYAPYAAGTSSTQTGPVISVPESENIINLYQYPSNNNEMIKKKRRLTDEQLASLEQSFQEDNKLDTDRKVKLSKELGMEPRQVAVWFQNRRSRWKLKYLEESYDSLRKDYEVVSRENQILNDEVKKLKGIILKDHLMRRETNLNSNQIAGGSQIYGIDQYNNRMLVASSCWPPISQPPYPW